MFPMSQSRQKFPNKKMYRRRRSLRRRITRSPREFRIISELLISRAGEDVRFLLLLYSLWTLLLLQILRFIRTLLGTHKKAIPIVSS
jgi:hypothetical protein